MKLLVAKQRGTQTEREGGCEAGPLELGVYGGE